MAGMLSKSGRIKGYELGDGAIEKINAQTLEPVDSPQVFVFSVVACDTEVDRSFERFDLKALNEMAELYIGKTVIKDHSRKSDNQIARVFDSHVEDAGGKSQLVLDCYMLADGSNEQLISEIKAGIKREVSVSFLPGSVVCSICGTDNRKGSCRHWWGEEYEGETCYFTLSDIQDVYELSFVAVPAQREAGTKKDYEEPQDRQEEPEQVEPHECGEPTDGSLSKEVAARIRVAEAYITMKE